MGARKKKAPAEAGQEATVQTTQQQGNGLTQNQSALVTLMAGVYANGMPFSAAQTAMQGKGDPNLELGALMQRGLVFQNGQGFFQLSRDATGNYAYVSGQPPVLPAGVPQPAPQQPPPVQQQAAPTPAPQAPTPTVQTAPQQPAAQPAPQAAQDGEGADDADDDDLPWWTTSEFQQAVITRADEIIRLLTTLNKALGGAGTTALLSAPTSAPEAAPPPPAPVAPPMQQYGQMPAGYPAAGTVSPPMQYGQPPAAVAPPNGQQPWQQPQFQNQQPFPPPGQPPPPPRVPTGSAASLPRTGPTRRITPPPAAAWSATSRRPSAT